MLGCLWGGTRAQPGLAGGRGSPPRPYGFPPQNRTYEPGKAVGTPPGGPPHHAAQGDRPGGRPGTGVRTLQDGGCGVESSQVRGLRRGRALWPCPPPPRHTRAGLASLWAMGPLSGPPSPGCSPCTPGRQDPLTSSAPPCTLSWAIRPPRSPSAPCQGPQLLSHSRPHLLALPLTPQTQLPKPAPPLLLTPQAHPAVARAGPSGSICGPSPSPLPAPHSACAHQPQVRWSPGLQPTVPPH